MLTLKNWNLARSRSGDCIVAWGLVSEHPLLRPDLSVHTSSVEKLQLANGALLVTTVSGSLYTLLPEWFDPGYREPTGSCLEQLGLDPGLTDAWAEARRRADRARQAEDEEQTAPGELLLEVIGTTALQAVFRTSEGVPVPLRPQVHLSMTQDSVLLADWNGRTVDFRFWPRYGRIVPYHISDGLRTIKLRNLGGDGVFFGQEGREVICPAGEITSIPAAAHDAEGLFSPDAVNGKSFFRRPLDRANEDQTGT